MKTTKLINEILVSIEKGHHTQKLNQMKIMIQSKHQKVIQQKEKNVTI